MKRRPYEFSAPTYDHRLGQRPKLRGLLVWTLVLAVIGLLLAKFWPEFRRQEALDREIARLEAKEAELREKRDAAKLESELLRDDPAYQEAVARDRLGLQREGESIVRIRRPNP